MQKTFVIGHRNPDTDSVCAPYAYAWLKRAIEPDTVFIPGVLGNLNPQTRFIFESLGIEPPALLRDVYPQAQDIMMQNPITAMENDPVGRVTQLMEEKKVRNVPVLDTAGKYAGLITMHEIAHYFMPRQYDARPQYQLRPENIAKVIPGYYLKAGLQEEYNLQLMVGAMAFDTFISRLNDSLRDGGAYPVLIVGNRPEIVQYALTQDFPIIILTGMKKPDCCELDLEKFKGWIYVSEVDTAETIRLLRISIPAKAIANRGLPVLAPQQKLREIKSILMKLDHHGIAVVDDGKLLGMVTGSLLIDPPRHRVIMVDHNEPAQSVEGIDHADIVEIIDHHRLDTIRSSKPIYVFAEALGSSCSLVYKHFKAKGIIPPKEIASLMLSGILSDTLILRSPTTTDEDISLAEDLAQISGLDIQEWGTEIFRHAASLSAIEPDLAIAQDFKIYKEEGYRVGIAQIEVITLRDLNQVKERFLEALLRAKEKFALDWVMLLITDIIEEESILLSSRFAKAEHFIYHKLDDNTYHLPDVLSRKKQLLPEVIFVLKQDN